MSVSRAGAVAAYHGEIVRPLVEILGERLLVLLSERCGRPPLQTVLIDLVRAFGTTLTANGSADRDDELVRIVFPR